MDRPQREWYSECPSCKQIRAEKTSKELVGLCGVCKRSISQHEIRPFVEPHAFSVRIDDRKGTERYRRSTFIRQRQSLTHFIDRVDDNSFQDKGLFRLVLKESGALFRYNLGPENKGFVLCKECGYSEPRRSYRSGRRHRRLRPFAGSMECGNDTPWTNKPLAYGHQFRSYCLIARLVAMPGSVESLAYALQRGLCLTTEVEEMDIGVSWRWLTSTQEKKGCEIILYDNTPGGSGFVREGFNNWDQVVKTTLGVCSGCKCARACYDCLKNYANQSQHEKLNRLSVVDFLGKTGAVLNSPA